MWTSWDDLQISVVTPPSANSGLGKSGSSLDIPNNDSGHICGVEELNM